MEPARLFIGELRPLSERSCVPGSIINACEKSSFGCTPWSKSAAGKRLSGRRDSEGERADSVRLCAVEFSAYMKKKRDGAMEKGTGSI